MGGMSDDIPAPAAAVTPLAESRPVAAHRRPPQYKPNQQPPRQGAKDQHEPEEPEDVMAALPAAVFSVEGQAVPVQLQGVFSRLLQELERLREQLKQAHRHEQWMEDQANHHPVLPVSHRHAFLRQVGRVQDASRRAGGLPGWLLYLHINGIEVVRSQQGLEAWDDLLRHAARRLSENLRQTDLLGYIDGGDFVVALTITEEESGMAKAGELVRLLSQPYFWGGQELHFAVTLGRTRLDDDLAPEQLLILADANRRGL